MSTMAVGSVRRGKRGTCRSSYVKLYIGRVNSDRLLVNRFFARVDPSRCGLSRCLSVRRCDQLKEQRLEVAATSALLRQAPRIIYAAGREQAGGETVTHVRPRRVI